MTENMDQLQRVGTDLITKLVQVIDSGIDKAPAVFADLAREFALYFVIKELPIISFGVFIAFVLLLIWGLRNRKQLEAENATGVLWIPFGAVVVSFCIFVSGFKESLQAYYAPKAFLIQEFRKER